MLLGNYKLIRFYEQPEELRLFDIAKDPGETRNLASGAAEKTSELERLMDSYLASVGADVPKVNSRFDPTKPASPRGFGGHRGRGGRR